MDKIFEDAHELIINNEFEVTQSEIKQVFSKIEEESVFDFLDLLDESLPCMHQSFDQNDSHIEKLLDKYAASFESQNGLKKHIYGINRLLKLVQYRQFKQYMLSKMTGNPCKFKKKVSIKKPWDFLKANQFGLHDKLKHKLLKPLWNKRIISTNFNHNSLKKSVKTFTLGENVEFVIPISPNQFLVVKREKSEGQNLHFEIFTLDFKLKTLKKTEHSPKVTLYSMHLFDYFEKEALLFIYFYGNGNRFYVKAFDFAEIKRKKECGSITLKFETYFEYHAQFQVIKSSKDVQFIFLDGKNGLIWLSLGDIFSFLKQKKKSNP